MNRQQQLVRCETKFAPVEVDSIKLDGSFSGYASLFNEVDQANDAVAPGAFTASLKTKTAGNIRMLFQHNPDEPIGVWKSIREDEKGLHVEGKILNKFGRGREVLELIREGALDGLSIGFKTKRSRVDPNNKVRWILSADLWEISVVTFPLLESARIETVKSAGSGLPSVREFERWLTRDAGFSRRQARQVIAKGYGEIGPERDALVAKNQPLAQTIRKATQLISSRR